MSCSREKVIPINTNEIIKNKLLYALGRCLASVGFQGLDEEVLAREAGVKRTNIYRFYGSLPQLVSAYAESGLFWPTSAELMQETRCDFEKLSSEQQVAAFFKSLLLCLRRRPQTLDILAREPLERNELAKRLEDVRVRTSLECFEHLNGKIPEKIDLSAIVALLAGAVFFLSMYSRKTKTFGGIDLQSEKGWQRIELAIEQLVQGSFED